MARTKLMAGNWKMNKLNGELAPFFEAFAKVAKPTPQSEILFAVPFTLLAKAAELARPHGIKIAAQNIHDQASGAFTGEVSTGMLKDVGVTWTLIGHSERRQYNGETDASVARKTQACLAAGVTPIVCVGETLAEREANQTEPVVGRQLKAVFDAVQDPKSMVIAYEPVWAIGTGKSATSAQAQDVHRFIRGMIRERYGAGTADSMRVLYGGSANPGNIAELLRQPDIDGGLVGGASLKPDDFAQMANASAAAPH